MTPKLQPPARSGHHYRLRSVTRFTSYACVRIQQLSEGAATDHHGLTAPVAHLHQN